MSWSSEREALIEQTLALVQSAIGRAEEPAPWSETKAFEGIRPTDTAIPSPFADLTLPRAATLTPPIVSSGLDREIRARVASFRAHQQRFDRERDEHFAAALARLRAALKDAPPLRPAKQK